VIYQILVHLYFWTSCCIKSAYELQHLLSSDVIRLLCKSIWTDFSPLAAAGVESAMPSQSCESWGSVDWKWPPMTEHNFRLSFKAPRDFSLYWIFQGEKQSLHWHFMKVSQGVLGKDGVSANSLPKAITSTVTLETKIGNRGTSLLSWSGKDGKDFFPELSIFCVKLSIF